MNFCWHQGNFYIADGKRLTQWNPSVRQFLTIVPDLPDAAVAISPAGHIFLADSNNSKLLMLQNGQLEVVLQMRGLRSVCCSSSGKLYLLGCTDQNLGWVVRLEGSDTVHVISSQDLFSKFRQVSVFVRMFVQEEDLYIVGWHMEDDSSDFVLKVTPDGETEVVGRGDGGDLRGLYLGEKGFFHVSKLGSIGDGWGYHLKNSWVILGGTLPPKIMVIIAKQKRTLFRRIPKSLQRDPSSNESWKEGYLKILNPKLFLENILICNLISTGLSLSF